MKQNQTLHFRKDFLPSFLSWGYTFVIALTTFFLPIFLKDNLGFTGFEIGILYGTISITGILITFPIGLLNDFIIPRNLVLGALVLISVSLWLQGEVFNFLPFLVVFVLFGIGSNLFKVSLDVLLFKSGENKLQGLRYGLFNFMRMLGFTFGAFFSGSMLYSIDFHFTLKGLAFLSLVLALFYPLLPENKCTKWELFNYRNDFFKREVIIFTLWLFFFSLHWGAETTCLGLFLRYNLKLSFREIGYYMGGEFLVVAFSALFFGWYYEHTKNIHLRSLLYFGLITSGSGHILMTTPHIFISFFWRVVHGVGDGIVSLVMYIGINRLFCLERIGGNSSLITMTTMIGIFVGSLIFSPVGEKAGYRYPLIISGIITISLISFLFLSGKEESKEEIS